MQCAIIHTKDNKSKNKDNKSKNKDNMPNNDYVRERLLRILDSVTNLSSGQITRKKLVRMFGASYSTQVNEMIGILISNGIFVKLGTGRRGDPVRIAKGKNYPSHVCPMCKQWIQPNT